MYRFDYSLIGRLPNLLGVPATNVVKTLKVAWPTFNQWKEGNMSCDALVNLCNTFRISISSFITVGNHPVHQDLASDYIISVEEWRPIEWHYEEIGNVFGLKGSLTGIAKTKAAERLNLSSHQIFDSWSNSPTAMRMLSMIELLNEFQIDASLFFRDPNRPIPLPAWEKGNKHIAEIIAGRMEDYRELERSLSDARSTISSLRKELERVKKENRALRVLKQGKVAEPTFGRNGMVAESGVQYSAPFMQRGYSFHRELWKALPKMFEMGGGEFCNAVGIRFSSFYTTENVPVPALIKACNLFRISITHFFVPKNEPLVVQDKGYYQMSPRMFVPIEGRIERMKYLFGRHSVLDYSREDLQRMNGIWGYGFRSMVDGDGERYRALTLADICTRFNIPPYLFFEDKNRKVAAYAQSTNEQLFLNAIALEQENEVLRNKLKEGK